MSVWNPQLNLMRVELQEEKVHEGLLHVETKAKSAFVRVKVLETGPYVGFDGTTHGWVQRAHAQKAKKGDYALVTRQDLLVHYVPNGGDAEGRIFFVRDNQIIALEVR